MFYYRICKITDLMNEKTNRYESWIFINLWYPCDTRSEQSDSDIECVSEVASEDDQAHDGYNLI